MDYRSNIHRSNNGHLNIKKYSKSYQKFGLEMLTISFFLYKVKTIDALLDKQQTDTLLENLVDQFDTTDSVGIQLAQILSQVDSKEFFKMDAYEKIIYQMTLCRIVDNFESYLKDILTEIVLLRPELLKSKDTETIEFVLGFDNYDDLISALAEKKVDKIGRAFDELVTFFENKIISPFVESDLKEIRNRIKERNIIVHNRGYINKQFIKEVNANEIWLGKEIIYDFERLMRTLLAFSNEVIIIDSKITYKFGLPTETGGMITFE